MRPKSKVLTDQELEIMKILWQRQSATVRDVYETLLEHRKIAYTTVLTMMKILEDKGYLLKSAADKAYVYAPSEPKEQVLGGMVNDFVDRVLSGSAKSMMLHLIDSDTVSQAELDEIALMLQQRKDRA
jgi:BlaI family transcriptional regulator, penicillinase repressor